MAENSKSNQPGGIPEVHKPPSRKMILTMGTVGLLAGLLIVFTYQITLPIIEKNRAEALQKAIFEVLPGTVTRVIFRVDNSGKLVPYNGKDPQVFRVYAGYDGEGNLVGVALEASGQGFQDVIHLIYGYSPQKQAIIGMKVLESKETPGLGDRIDKDPDFKANFKNLEVRVAPDGSSILHPIELVKKGKKTANWQIEAITGATISSRAVTRILKKSTARVIPIIMKNLKFLKEYKGK